jgi:hypothetical protein
MWPFKKKIDNKQSDYNISIQKDPIAYDKTTDLFTTEIKQGINIALNEAQILGIEFDKDKEIVAVTFAPIAIDQDGKVPTDNRVQFVFNPVGRFVASYKTGRWDDDNAKILKFEPQDIFNKVQEFNHSPIYGWKFIDVDDKEFNKWKNKLSFDYTSNQHNGLRHTINLFQDGNSKTINIKIWFDNFEIFDSNYNKINLETFIENGKRGWDAVYGHDPAAKGFGIFPIKDK